MQIESHAEALTRRHFIRRAGAFGIGFVALRTALARTHNHIDLADTVLRWGPLQTDPDGIFDLPAGFEYHVFSHTGSEMSDGLLVPAKHDGMAAFPGPRGLTLIVRNHEMEHGFKGSAFGQDDERRDRIDPAHLYDDGRSKGASRGGTTTIVYNTRAGRRQGKVVREYLSLAGTERNCAGGPTPRNTWLSCEESVQRIGAGHQRDHGYIFEVPAKPNAKPVKPVPLVAMGRFFHEAVATDARTGIVYLTEDRLDGLLYRFIPAHRDRLAEGGRLQALAVSGHPRFDTNNWGRKPSVEIGDRLPAEWIDMHDVDSPDDSLRAQGFDRGAARFCRGEGMWAGDGVIYFACTEGGKARKGQVWKLHIDPQGTSDHVELFVEPNDARIIDNADNITVAPWGDLIVCEDGDDEQFLLGITPKGEVYKLARNAANDSEVAGATFSPDGTTLFVNVQKPGYTIAIRRTSGGPWFL